jgi:hypothetical protein
MKIDPNIISQYLPADEDFVVNIGKPDGTERDPSLTPIRISLPKPPNLELIDGYGLKPEDQKFRRIQIPEKLIVLEKKVKKDFELRQDDKGNTIIKANETLTGYKIVEEIWKRIQENIDEYKDEIDFIRKLYWYRLNGYWCFIKGKPTFISAWHWFYLNFWKIDGSFYPEFRNDDRVEMLAWTYFKNTKESFKRLDENGNAILGVNGEYEMIDMAYEVFFGIAEPKGRRQGVSNKAQCCQFEVISRKKSALGVIFSMTEDSAGKLFRNITVRAFRHMPFFFIPVFDGYYDQSKEIFFNRPKNVIIGDDLQSRIVHAESAYGGEFDGTKIDMAVYDEPGKTKQVDVTRRWSVHKRASALGLKILGFSFHVSTTEDLDIDGGKHFQKMVYSSNFYNRNAISGQTSTGLVTIFMPSYLRYEECIDAWGFSIVDNPTEEQIKAGYRLKHGAKKILQSERDDLLREKNLIEYQRLVVKFPFTLDECFQLTIGSSDLGVDLINTRNAELRRIKPPLRGNFEYVPGKRYEEVYFDEKADGRWEVSRLLNPGECNLKVQVPIFDEFDGTVKNAWMPKYPNKYTIGVDPFDYKGTKALAIDTGSYMSSGGIAVFWELDSSIDRSDNMYEWESYKFAAVYRNRPSSDVFDEDVLKAAIYYGSMVYPETNKGNIWKYFTDKNFDGYLLYEWDEGSGKFKQKPGCFQLEKSKQDIWDAFRQHIKFRVHKEMHVSLLTEIASLKSFDDLTKNDMAAAAGLALLGSRSRSRKALESVDDSKNDLGWWADMA